jgi:hypothetical protein
MAISNFSHFFDRVSKQIKLGFSGNLDDLLNHRQSWALTGNYLGQVQTDLTATSISDTNIYNTICNLAAEDPRIFSKFKSCEQYREILEHVSRDLGLAYYTELLKDEWIMKRLGIILQDGPGLPFRYTYKGIGRVSPTNLRYAKVVSDLHKVFGKLDNYRIAEIGVGYGGQCVGISKVFDFASYVMYDLASTLKLAQRYVSEMSPNVPVKMGDYTNLVTQSLDLVISNYAFSELQRELQEEYFSKIIAVSNRGFITYNDISPESFNYMDYKEFAERIPGSEIFFENPTTNEENRIILWGHDSREANLLYKKAR